MSHLINLTIKASPEILRIFLRILASTSTDAEDNVTDLILPNLSELKIDLFYNEKYETLIEDLINVLGTRAYFFTSHSRRGQSSSHDSPMNIDMHSTHHQIKLNSLRITETLAIDQDKRLRLGGLVKHLYVRVDDEKMDADGDSDSNCDSDWSIETAAVTELVEEANATGGACRIGNAERTCGILM